MSSESGDAATIVQLHDLGHICAGRGEHGGEMRKAAGAAVKLKKRAGTRFCRKNAKDVPEG